MEQMCSVYIYGLMEYIELEYDNIPSEVTEEMNEYFVECFNNGQPVCLPNAAGGFWERFLKNPENL